MVKKVVTILSWTLSIALLISAVTLLIVATPLFGNKALIVRSGSMEPAISVGDMVIVRPSTGSEYPKQNPYQVGQVISYKLPEHNNMVVTHRVTSASAGAYRTKGDANNEEDSYTVPPNQIIGRQVFVVPYIGKLLAFAKTKVGFISLVVIPALAVIIGEAFVIVRELRHKKTTPEAEPQPTPAVILTAPPAEDDLEYRPPSVEAEPWPNEVAHLFNATAHHMRPVVDSLSRRLVVFLAALLAVTSSTWALYSDTGTSSNNIFTAAEDFGVGPGDVVINEVMWMGSWSGSSAKINDEWIELRNITSETIDITDWEIEGAGSGASEVIVLTGGSIPPNGFYLISNFDADHSSSALRDDINIDFQDSNVGLDNEGEQLILKGTSSEIIDSTPVTAGAWAAGVNDNTTPLKQSMSRNDPPADGTVGSNWHTCTAAGCNDTTYWDAEANNYGTPKATNL